MEGVSLYGLGNWPEISEHVSTKTTEECKQHFFSVYVDTPTFPEPSPPLTREQVDSLSPMPPGVPATHDKERKEKPRTPLSQPAKPQYGSYMPYRMEFDTPWNEEIEEIPARTVFMEDDTPEERALKIAALTVYSNVLEERKRRTHFLLRCELLDYRQHQAFEKGLTRDDAQILQLVRPFLQCQTKEQWERFVNGLLAEQHLRREIRNYQQLRESGLHWLNEVDKSNFKKSKSMHALARAPSITSLERHNLRSSGGFPTFQSSTSLMLATVEREQCDVLNISPEAYLLAKEAFVRENLRVGKLLKSDCRQLVALPAHQAEALYDFFVSQGWLNRSGVTVTAPYSALEMTPTLVPAAPAIMGGGSGGGGAQQPKMLYSQTLKNPFGRDAT